MLPQVMKATQGNSSNTFGAFTTNGAEERGVRLLAGLLGLLLVALALAPASSAARAEGVTWQVPVVQLPKVDPALDRDNATPTSVIVQAFAGHVERTRDLVRSVGGTVMTDLPLVDGFEAEIAGTSLSALELQPEVRSITANTTGTFEEYSYEESTTASSFARTSGATSGWSKGLLGDGVGVAVIDTGVSAMKDFQGRLVHGPDLSGEGTVTDTYGHGTVMAGVIGGSGADSAGRTGGAYTGVAPRSTLVSVKVAGRNAAVDVSTILQAMHWVSAYKSQFNIRVLNLSWGTKSTQHHSIDPLNYAVQRLWRDGIVVVVAAGNSGPKSGTVTKPGDDPMVLTVGSFDDKQNVDPADDSLSPWSSQGPTAAGLTKPDILAPGRSLVATRSYGSYVEQTYPKALISPSYIKGSGTSEAAAVMSGLAALLIQSNPSLTPDQVKAMITRTASPLANQTANAQGHGRVQFGAALAATPGLPQWQVPTSTGLGSIEASRGGMNVETDCHGDGDTDLVIGEIDVECEAWNGSAWTGSAWTGSAWTGSAWTGSAWTGSAWTGSAWTGSAWTGSAWTGGVWTGSAWTGSAWTGSAWTGSAWTGSAWTGSAWTGSAWTGSAWTTAEYEEEFLNAFWGNTPPTGSRFERLEAAADKAPVAATGPPGDTAKDPASRPGRPTATDAVTEPAPVTDTLTGGLIEQLSETLDEIDTEATDTTTDPAADTAEPVGEAPPVTEPVLTESPVGKPAPADTGSLR